jgi:hypothetical protein
MTQELNEQGEWVDVPELGADRMRTVPDLTLGEIARVVHEANRALQIVQSDPTIPVSPGWDDLDAETRRSAVEGVAGVLNGNSPRESHQGWCEFKTAHGWTLGPVKDEVAKTHPLLVPYDQLPPSQQLKDHLFVAIVKALS